MHDDDDKPCMREMLPEDLSTLSVKELEDWIEFLQSEIKRAKAGIQAKKGVRTDADALFSFGE